MQQFIGTKTIKARPMVRGEYNAYRGWSLPVDEHGADEGYLVEYTDGGKPNDARHAGYISWSPKDVFERTYTTVASQPTGDDAIEQAIQAAGKTAPRVTPPELQAIIASHWFFTAAEGVEGAAAAGTPLAEQPPVATGSPLRLLTVCVLVLRNGFTVTGESACASPENFNPEIGRQIARQNAEKKIWPLLGYQLKEQLFQRTQPACSPE